MNDDTIRISEIFGPTIQGEGALIGQPTVFVRSGGCDYRCSWCDTLHAVESAYRHEWTPMNAEEIFDEIRMLSGDTPLTVSLSGGNPAIQPFGPLIRLGQRKGYRFAVETQGSVAQDWFADLDVITLSPKPPSSGMDTDWETVSECIQIAGDGPEIVLKIVIFDKEDYRYAQEAAARYPDMPVYLQPGNEQVGNDPVDHERLTERLVWLADKVNEDKWFNVSVLPQLHVMMWGNKRGV